MASKDHQSGASTPQSQQHGTRKPAPSKREIKILMLHGYTQSGPLFHAKTRGLEKLLIKTLAPYGVQPTLLYPTAPHRLLPSDIPGAGADADADADPRAADSWAWLRRDDATGTYRLLAGGMARVAETVREAGGVDGVVGFSQGAAVAAMAAAALEPDRRVAADDPDSAAWVRDLRDANRGRPLRFAVVYSGFAAAPPALAWLHDPPVRTPTLHFIGSLDTVVDETRARGLVAKCVDPVVVEHPGGHYVPVSKEWAMPLIGFIKKHCVDNVDAANATV